MMFADSELQRVAEIVKRCLSTLYEADSFLFERNGIRGVCERCLVFRFAHYLQNELPEFYVDCDFNSSAVVEKSTSGQLVVAERPRKEIINPDGTITGRFIDIIVHKRDYETMNDYICFEFKKWNNRKREDLEKDINNLKQLTSRYHYRFGLLLTFGEVLDKTKWTIFSSGRELVEEQFVFGN
ncbi:MAG: hypothetical protein R3F48_08445 [Candidatus Zixiibacteriota bacterium]